MSAETPVDHSNLPFGETAILDVDIADGKKEHHKGTCIFIHGLGFNTGPVWKKRFEELKERYISNVSGDDADPEVSAVGEDAGGSRANSSAFSKMKEYLTHTRFVFPTAPLRPMSYVRDEALHGWYNVYGKGPRNGEPCPGIEASCKHLHELVEAEGKLLSERTGGAAGTQNILFAGFSQGGTMTTVAGHTCPFKLGALGALSGYSCSRENYFTASNIQSVNLKTPYLILQGDKDDIVLPEYGEETMRVMRDEVRTATAGGSAPEYKEIPGLDHSVPDEVLNYLFVHYGLPTHLGVSKL